LIARRVEGRASRAKSYIGDRESVMGKAGKFNPEFALGIAEIMGGAVKRVKK